MGFTEEGNSMSDESKKKAGLPELKGLAFLILKQEFLFSK